MKKAQRKDLFRELKHSLNRYLSILAIMALGVAFYAGVRSAEPDMQLTAKAFYDATDFMDIRVIGTMGLTDADVEAVQKIDGIDMAEGAYYAESYLVANAKTFQLSLFSVGDLVNKVEVTEGRLPETASECLMDEYFMEKLGFQIGDVITLSSDKEVDLSETLNGTTYTIVGKGKYAEYLSWERGTVSIGTGKANGFLFLPKSAFASDVYTSIYATVDGAKDLNCYSDEYEELVDEVQAALEDIEAERCDIRYSEALAPAREEIADAEAEIADGEKELADNEQKIIDGEKELADGEAELLEKEQEIKDAEQKIADGEAEIAEKEIEIADGEKELADGEAELVEKEQELKDAEAELAESREKLENGKKEAEAAEAVLVEGRKQLEAARAEIDAAKKQLEAYGMPMTPELIAAEAELLAKEQELIYGENELAATKETFAAAEQQIKDGEAKLADGKIKLADAKKQLEDAKAELSDGRIKLADARAELETAKTELADGKIKLEEGRTELADARKELEDGRIELEDGKAELEDAKVKLADAKAELADVEFPEWYVLGRDSVRSFVEYGMDTERIGKIGKVFPAVFYLVAALVSLTTMTRMVEEERTQIGTMKALGYKKASIAGKYLWYSLSASLIGGIIGIALGSSILPAVIIGAYQILYAHLPAPVMPVQWDISLMSIVIAVFCTVAATMLACYKELAAAPSVLMRPEAPKEGKRVLLEYVTFLWKHFSFSWKATCRNLFRYKKRLFMTVFGIGGCMALLMVGFGLRDSIADIVNNQYKKLWTYDTYLGINSTEIEIQKDEIIHDSIFAQLKTVDLMSETEEKSAELFVPARLDGLEEFLKLTDRRKKNVRYELGEEGVVLSEKLANMLEVGVGDTVSIKTDEWHSVSATVTAVVENYLNHYIYMSAKQYEALYNEAPEYNQILLKTSAMTESEREEFSKNMMDEDAVDSVVHVVNLQEHVDDMMRSLNLVVVVLIVSAAMLAFIVLYNLNNINIIERRRELATIKVLGFYDGELAMYVYRENILLTLFGILFGIVIGFFLHRFVILTCEIDMIMFGRDISLLSYAASIALTALFAFLVNVGMFYKLRKIDMVESLKSME